MIRSTDCPIIVRFMAALWRRMSGTAAAPSRKFDEPPELVLQFPRLLE
jgi:hypothetical protein